MDKVCLKLLDPYKKHCRCILWSILTLALLFSLRNLIIEIIWDVNELSWITYVDQDSLGWLFIILCIFVSCYLSKKCKDKNIVISDSYVSISVILALCYLFVRIEGTIGFNKIFWKFAYADFVFLPIVTILSFSLKRCLQKHTESPQCSTFNDRPICSERDDELGFGKMIDILLDDIKHTDLSREAFSIGIVGKWGQGKSSFANLLIGRLDQQKTILIEFNPRNSKNIESIAEDFFNIFSDALHPYHTGIKSRIKKYANALQIVLDDNIIGKSISFIQNISAFDSKEHINKAINEIGRTIFVVVDDLDRLTAKEILETLKLIDRNADFVNTVFVTAYDKDYVNDVLKHYLGYKSEIFTDKYFDYELSLPVPDANSIFKIIGKYITLNSTDKSPKLFSEFWSKNGRHYVKSFPNLRHIKRFINIFLNRYKYVCDDVDTRDFFLLMLLRYYDITIYNEIAVQRFLKTGSLLSGGETHILYLRNDELAKANNIKWEFSMEVLNALFPAEGKDTSNSYQHIWDIRYFDLYFYDYKEGKLYLKDLNALFNAKDESEATNNLDLFIKRDSQSLYSYLENVPKTKVATLGGLTRYLRLCLQFRSHCDHENYSLLYELSEPLRKDSYRWYKNNFGIQNRTKYTSTMLDIYKTFISVHPLQLQQLFQLISENKENGTEMIVSKDDCRDIELECQRTFLQNFDEHKDKISDVFSISNILVQNDGKCDLEACRTLQRFMMLHKNFVSTNIFGVNVCPSADDMFLQLNIYFDQAYRKFIRWFPIDGFAFHDWIDSIENDRLRFILLETYKQPIGMLSVKALRSNYKKEDIDGIYEAILNDYESRDIALIKTASNNENVFDLPSLCKFSGLKKERIIALAKTSENNLGLPDRLLKTMQPFEVGDIVKLRADIQKTMEEQTGEKRKLFKISSLQKGDFLLLDGIATAIPLNDILPVGIGSEDDKSIYYDPIVVASILAPGQAHPIHYPNYEYYLSQLKKSTYEGHTLYDLIKKNGLSYVHEVQHLLREGTNDDGLQIRYGTISSRKSR